MMTKYRYYEECHGICVSEELCECTNCGATYQYDYGAEIWMTKEQQEEFDKKYDEYMEQRSKEQVQSNNESCDELPW